MKGPVQEAAEGESPATAVAAVLVAAAVLGKAAAAADFKHLGSLGNWLTMVVLRTRHFSRCLMVALAEGMGAGNLVAIASAKADPGAAHSA